MNAFRKALPIESLRLVQLEEELFEDDDVGERQDEEEDVDNDDGDTENPIVAAAQLLFDSGDFKTNPVFNTCWINAWIAAQKNARMIAVAMRKKLLTFRNDADGELLAIPPKSKGEQWKEISVFAFALFRMKVAKFIQKQAEGDRSGLRLSHGPEWAREDIRLNETLLGVERGQETDLDSQASDEVRDAKVSYGGLVIVRIITGTERDDMNKKARM